MSIHLLNLCACLPILLCMQIKTKDAHVGMSVGDGGGQTGLIGWGRGGWGFHHMFGSQGLLIALPHTHIYIYIYIYIF
jgi:hypothetical protein